MNIDTVRSICRSLRSVTEDIKWGNNLCFCVGSKMFVVVSLEAPHSIAFKCTPETFGELIERPGIIPAPYMARNMWVQEQELGEALERRELEPLIRTAYELVVATLPKSKRPDAAGTVKTRAGIKTRPAARNTRSTARNKRSRST